jgi:hypothetical protein
MIIGCKDADDQSTASCQSTFLEFQIALRQETVEQEPSVNAGTFRVVSDHKIPVHVGKGPEEATSIANDIWVDVRCNRSELRRGRVWLHGLQYRIRNRMFYNGDGGGMGWASAGGLGLSSDWAHLNSRIDLSSTRAGPLLYHRIRWLNPSPSIRDIEMSEVVQENGGEET